MLKKSSHYTQSANFLFILPKSPSRVRFCQVMATQRHFALKKLHFYFSIINSPRARSQDDIIGHF